MNSITVTSAKYVAPLRVELTYSDEVATWKEDCVVSGGNL